MSKIYLVDKHSKTAIKEFDSIQKAVDYYVDNKKKYNSNQYILMTEGEAKIRKINLDIKEGLDYNENISESDIRIISGNGYNVKIVNKYWNMWNKIRNRRDQDDWEKKVGLLRFGSHLTETLSDIIKNNQEYIELSTGNKIVRDNFIKEIDKAVEKYNTKEYRNQIVKEDLDISESTTSEKLAKIRSAYYYLRNKKKELSPYQFNKKYGDKWFKVKLMYDKMKEGKLTKTDKSDAHKMIKSKSLKNTSEDKKAMDYFKAEAKKYTLKPDELKHRWDKAKDIAQSQGKNKDWGYIRGIYKRMVDKYKKDSTNEEPMKNKNQERIEKLEKKIKMYEKKIDAIPMGTRAGRIKQREYEDMIDSLEYEISKLTKKSSVNEDTEITEGKLKRQMGRGRNIKGFKGRGMGKDEGKIKQAYKYLASKKNKMSADDFETKYGDQWLTIKKLYDECATVKEDIDVSESEQNRNRAWMLKMAILQHNRFKKGEAKSLTDVVIGNMNNKTANKLRYLLKKYTLIELKEKYKQIGINPFKEDISEGRMATHMNDDLLQGMTFQDLIDTVTSNEKVFNEASIKKVFLQMVSQRLTDAKAELRDNMKVIIKALGVREDIEDFDNLNEDVDSIKDLKSELEALKSSKSIKAVMNNKLKELVKQYITDYDNDENNAEEEAEKWKLIKDFKKWLNNK
jgi:hypothetical protein